MGLGELIDDEIDSELVCRQMTKYEEYYNIQIIYHIVEYRKRCTT